jgi:hypothetical protein
MENLSEVADYDQRAKRGGGRSKVIINAAMPLEMIERVKAAAKVEDRPVSSIIRRAVDRYLASEHGEAA